MDFFSKKTIDISAAYKAASTPTVNVKTPEVTIPEIKAYFYEEVNKIPEYQFPFAKRIARAPTCPAHVKTALAGYTERMLLQLAMSLSDVPKVLAVTSFNAPKILKVEGYGQDVRTIPEFKQEFVKDQADGKPGLLSSCFTRQRGDDRALAPTAVVTVSKDEKVQHVPIVQGLMQLDYLDLGTAYTVLPVDTAVNSVVSFLTTKTRITNGKFVVQLGSGADFVMDGYTVAFSSNAATALNVLCLSFQEWFESKITITGLTLDKHSNFSGSDYGHMLYGWIGGTLLRGDDVTKVTNFITQFNAIFNEGHKPLCLTYTSSNEPLLNFKSIAPKSIATFANSRINFTGNVEYSVALKALSACRSVCGENDDGINTAVRSSVIGVQLNIDIMNIIGMSSNFSAYKLHKRTYFIEAGVEVAFNVLLALAVNKFDGDVYVKGDPKLAMHLDLIQDSVYKLRVRDSIIVHIVSDLSVSLFTYMKNNVDHVDRTVLIDLRSSKDMEMKNYDAGVRNLKVKKDLKTRVSDWGALGCSIIARSSYYDGMNATGTASNLDADKFLAEYKLLSAVELNEGVLWISKGVPLADNVSDGAGLNKYDITDGDAGQFLKAMTLINLYRMFFTVTHQSIYALLGKHIKVPRLIKKDISVFVSASASNVDFSTLSEAELMFFVSKGSISQKSAADDMLHPSASVPTNSAPSASDDFGTDDIGIMGGGT